MSADHTTPNASAGKLHFLDLADLKAQMGKKWLRMEDTVERFFEGAMRRNLGPGDSFVRQGELSYILLFRSLGPEEAQLKCRTICEEVCERLFGDQLYRASLRTLIAPMKSDFPDGENVAETLDELLETEGKETIFRVDPAGEQEPSADPKSPPPDVKTPEELSFVYRPIWDATKNVVVTYLCQSADDRQFSSTGPNGENIPPQEQQATIDKHVLKECAARNIQLHQSGLRILSGVAVALDTLSHSRLWSSYSRDLQAISPKVSRDFAFFVTGIDSGVPNIRLAQELPKLNRLSHQIFCVIDDRGYVGARFARTGAHAIGIHLSTDESESASMGRIVELARQAADAGLAAFVLGVPSTCIMLHALGQGIRYLEGAIIRPAVSDPRHAFSQSLEYVYKSKSGDPHHNKQNVS